MKLLLAILLCVPSVIAAPVVFSSDVIYGMASGGHSYNADGCAGQIVTVYGGRFGASQGGSTIKLNGTSMSVISWGSTSLHSITFRNGIQAIIAQVCGSTTTGQIVVNVGGANSTCADIINSCNFTITTSKHIYFVSGTGNDSNDGSFATPWLTPRHARDSVAAGDTVYLMTGSDQLCVESMRNAAFEIGSGRGVTGTSGNPIAFVVYPGATVQIGTADPQGDGCGVQDEPRFAVYDNTGYNYWLFSGVTLRNVGPDGTVLLGGTNTRMVANDIAPLDSNSPDGGIYTGADTQYILLNNIHDSGKNCNGVSEYPCFNSGGNPSKQFHQVYIASSHIWVGWNAFHDDYDCRHIMVNQDVGPGFGDIHIFGNTLTNDSCDAIDFANIDPSISGGIEVFNNIIWNVGNNLGGTGGNFAGIYLADGDGGGSPASGVVQVYNNTFYDIGSFAASSGQRGVINKLGTNALTTVNLRNNVAYIISGEHYLCSSGDASCDSGASLSQITGDHNLWFCTGTCPSVPTQTTSNVTTDPLFTSLVTPNFHLLSASPAKSGGDTISTASPDFDGVTRPTHTTYALGAYELVSSPVYCCSR